MGTIYIVQSFRLKGKKLTADPAQSARSPEAAIALAERMAPSRAGVAAFSQEADLETDTYDEPVLLFSTGTLPPGLGS